jgi:hypothetical protein
LFDSSESTSVIVLPFAKNKDVMGYRNLFLNHKYLRMRLRTFTLSIVCFLLFGVSTVSTKAQTVCCPLPDSLTVTSVTDSSFCVRWRITDSVACDTPHAGTLQYKPVGTMTWTTVQMTYSYPYFYATKCDTARPCTKYQWRVRNKCVTSDTTINTAWVAGPRFTTNCDSTGRTANSLGIIRVYPNPAKSSIVVNGTFSDVRHAKITIADMQGNQKMQKEITPFNGVVKLPVDISTWNKGIYFITVTDGKTSSRYSFIKE